MVKFLQQKLATQISQYVVVTIIVFSVCRNREKQYC